MDAFKDRLSQRAQDTTRPALAHQSRGRALEPYEQDLADALIDIYRTGTHQFDRVVAELNARGITAPRSGRSDWDVELLEEELIATNRLLDEAYQVDGYGA